MAREVITRRALLKATASVSAVAIAAGLPALGYQHLMVIEPEELLIDVRWFSVRDLEAVSHGWKPTEVRVADKVMMYRPKPHITQLMHRLREDKARRA